MPSTLLISSRLSCRRSAIAAFWLTAFLVGAGRSWCQEANITNIAFPGAELAVVLVEYQTLTGNHLIVTPGTEATVTVVQNPDSPMTKAQAIDFIRDSLLYHGIAILPERPGVEKVVPWTGGTPFDWPSPEPGYQKVLYTDPSELPEGNAFINYSMRLQYVGAEEAAQQFTTLMPPQSWRYTPIPSAGTVIISATVPVIRTLLALKEQIDVREQARENRFVQLRLADAEEVAGQITELISAQEQLRSQNGRVGTRSAAQALAGNAANPNSVPVPLQGVPGGGGEGSNQTATISSGSGVIVQADARTNRILLNGRNVDVDYIETLVLEFDQPAEVESLLTKQLRYFSVIDFLDVAAGGLERFSSRGAGGIGGAAGGGQSRQNRQTQTQANGAGALGNQGFGGNQTSSSRSSRSGGGAGGAGGGSGRQLQTQQLIPESVTVDKTLLIADPRSNSIIVSGPPEHLSFITELIEKMDVRPLQVYISAVLAQVTLGDNIQFGIDILRTVENFEVGGETVNAAGFFRNVTGGTGIIDPTSLGTVADFGTATASGLNTYAQIGDYFTGYLRALEARNDFKVLARPFIYTANNEVATISIGERVPVPTSQQSSVVTGGTQSLNTNIDFEDVLLELQVAPLISSENEVTLTIAQVNDNITGSSNINGDEIPIISTQTLDTTVTVPNGGVVVIGGLISKSESKTNSGLPFITKLPILKTLLGNSTKDFSRSELLIFVQPRIITTTSSLVAAHTDQVRRSVIADEVEEFAQPPYDTDNSILPSHDGDIQWKDAGKIDANQSEGDGAEPKNIDETDSRAKKTRKKSLGSWIKGVFNSN
ncbi:MAG: hypothetical protein O3C21_16580 [Verrucomicrobia bacterium]|nr:hypothetical protein [Verrucomicrobiota bacterium]